MFYQNTSLLARIRHPMWLLTMLALFTFTAQAWNGSTCEQFGTCHDGAAWEITQDVWGAATNWQQCLYVDSHSKWQVVANLKGQTWVGSYPHASYTVGKSLDDVLKSSTPLMAAWDASYPKSNKFDFAYDLWLNGTTYEVMIWLNWSNTSPIGDHPFTNAVIDGISYDVYEGAGGSGPHCISFLPKNGMMDTATNFNLCSILHWISVLKWNGGPGGCYWQNPKFNDVQLGWEICDTYGRSVTYTMNYFDVYHGKTNTPPTPTANFSPWINDPASGYSGFALNPYVGHGLGGQSADRFWADEGGGVGYALNKRTLF